MNIKRSTSRVTDFHACPILVQRSFREWPKESYKYSHCPSAQHGRASSPVLLAAVRYAKTKGPKVEPDEIGRENIYTEK